MPRGNHSIVWWTVLAAAILPTEPMHAEDLDDRALAQSARTILERNCYRCHGKDGAAEGKINFILDRGKLVSRRMIIPGDSAKSRLFEQVSDEIMPPDGAEPRPSEADVLLLKRWIDAGAPDFEIGPHPRLFRADREVLNCMADDLRKTDAPDRRFIRYFISTHLYNAGLSDSELELTRSALVKLINSLSWGPRIVVPQSIDAANTVYRVDLRDLRWDPTTWDRIIAANPYGVIQSDKELAVLYESSLGKLPYVRTDWFVHAASRPPLYHDVLDLPATAQELERELRVDVAEDILRGRAARAGFNGSGVSQHNRLIERHESRFGAYWISYDFAGSSERKNLFSRPLGPRSIGKSINSFEHDGGEIIFNLPNGLQAYLLVDANGVRIDKGPTSIVSDPKRPDRAVENGISCMSCHVRGMIPKDDQIRPHIKKNLAAFKDAGELQTILVLYQPHDAFRSLLKDDEERFRKALEQCGIQADRTEPISAVAARFEAELDLPTAAAEVGLKDDEFLRRLNQSVRLPRKLGTLNVPGGTVKRETFLAAFMDIVRELNLGTPFVVRNTPKPPAAVNRDRKQFDRFGDPTPAGATSPKPGPTATRVRDVLLGEGSSPRLSISARGQSNKAAASSRATNKSEIRPPDFDRCAELLAQSVVQVRTNLMVGAGFAVADGTAIVTTNRVIDKASIIEIETSDSRRQEAALILAIPDRDLAILRILEPLKPLTLATEDQFIFQTPVMLIDRAADATMLRSSGVLTSLFNGTSSPPSSSADNLSTDTMLLATDAPAAKAHAGTPLVTPDALVVGVMRKGDAAVHVSHIKESLGRALPDFKPGKARLSGLEKVRLDRMRRTIALQQLESQEKRKPQTIDNTAMGMFINSFNQFMPRVP